MSATDAILRSYRAPREVARAHKARGADEVTLLTWLIFACILFFVARLPALQRVAHDSGETVPFFGLALGAFYGTILLAPLGAYLVAALSHLVARALGGHGGWRDARIALFWALLAVTPLVLLRGLVAGFIGPGPELTCISVFAFAGFVFLWINGVLALYREQA